MSAEETVARVLDEHRTVVTGRSVGPESWPSLVALCGCGWTGKANEGRAHVAAEIVRALGLVEERIETAMCDDETRTISDRQTEVRYVTPWQPVEEASDVDA